MPFNRVFYAAETLYGTSIYASELGELQHNPLILRATIRQTCWGEVREKLIEAMEQEKEAN